VGVTNNAGPNASATELTSVRDELSRQLDDMTRLHALSTTLSTGLEIQPICEEILRAVTELDRAPMASLRLFDPGRNELQMVASIGISEEFCSTHRDAPLDAGASSVAVRESRTVIAEDLQRDLPESAAPEFVKVHGIRAVCSTPIIARSGCVLGAISSYWREPHRPSERQVRLVQLYANHAGNVIETVQLYQQAQQANRLKDEFLATVSHELRTPLNAIFGWVHLLRRGKLDAAKAERALNIIERNARLQTQLIDDLLDVSRIVTGKLRLNLAPVELSGVVAAALEGVRPAAQAKNIRMDQVLDSAVPPVMGDAGRLHQIIWNLLSNAVKFTPIDGKVEIALRQTAQGVFLSVSDTGQGIPPDFLPYVFDRFRQADGTRSRSHGGLGLGLSIVRNLVELHGGKVTVQSDGLDKGATFTIAFPSSTTALEARGAAQAAESGRMRNLSIDSGALNDVRVLIVDDSSDERETLQVLLSHYGAQVRVAGSAAEALSELARCAPNVLVSDIEMPGEDGYALIAQVRRRTPDEGGRTPAIALTAYTRLEDRMSALKAGYQLHVPKPVEPAELVTAVASLAGRLNKLAS
jgi:signal transduction histidine kinase/ActR/RegA family two-component response regulator